MAINMEHKNLIDLEYMTIDELKQTIRLAKVIKSRPDVYKHACDGKIMATLFYEPSTRTQMSFQAAMMRLGGKTIGFDNPMNSSVAKGENLKDTITIISSYSDIIAMRHPSEGSAKAASLYSSVPLINCGDGGHFHPTQTLTDVCTLSFEKGRLDNLKIGLCGDLLNGRTVHSLIKTMSHFENNCFVLISTKELSIPKYIKDILENAGCEYEEKDNLKDAISDLDVLYMTRIQRERFSSEEDYEKQKGVFVLDAEKLALAKEDMIILHPLPRVDEIAIEVDDDPRACYFKQAEYGMYGRMALIVLLLRERGSFTFSTPDPIIKKDLKCSCKKCITNDPQQFYLPKNTYEKNGKFFCDYCDNIMK
jgi:aspartate carbamoyltransferase catalytic subunit